jgi:hypothetical protein
VPPQQQHSNGLPPRPGAAPLSPLMTKRSFHDSGI